MRHVSVTVKDLLSVPESSEVCVGDRVRLADDRTGTVVTQMGQASWVEIDGTIRVAENCHTGPAIEIVRTRDLRQIPKEA